LAKVSLSLRFRPAFVAQPEHCAKATIGRQEAIGNESTRAAHSGISRSADILFRSNVEIFKPAHTENSSHIAKPFSLCRPSAALVQGFISGLLSQGKGLLHINS
jgi:hypothetical protein